MNYPKKLFLIVLAVCLVLSLIGLTGCPSPTTTPVTTGEQPVLPNASAIAAYNLGLAQASISNYDGTIAKYTEAIELDPKYADAYFNRGTAYYYKGQNDLAIADYSKTIELDPKYANAYYNRGVAYSSKGQNDLAKADYNKALQLTTNPALTQAAKEKLASLSQSSATTQAATQASGYNQQGVALFSQGKNDEAIAEFSRAIQVYPNYPTAYTNRGIVYIAKTQYNTAITDFNNAIKLNPNYALAYGNRGLAYIYTQRYEEAVIDLNKSLEIDPADDIAWNNKGVALEQTGDIAGAIDSYDTALKFNPDNEQAKNNGKVIQVGGRPPGININAWCSHYPPRIQEAWTGETPSEDLSLAAAGAQAVPQGGVGITIPTLTGEWINNSPSYGFVMSEGGWLTWSFDVVLKLVEKNENPVGGVHEERPNTFTGTIQTTLRGFDIGDGVHLNSDDIKTQASMRADIGQSSTRAVSGTRSGNVVTLYLDNKNLHLSFDGDYLNGVTTLYNYYGIRTDVKPSTEGSYITEKYSFYLRRK
jgi:tetratricopeptide (TPR) repeat protein